MSNFAKKTHVAKLKSDLDKLDIDKLKNVPSKLSNLKSRVDKDDYDKKISEIKNWIIDHDHSNKYITTQEFNNLTLKNWLLD